ncbi:MAG: hypothetical protein Q4G05_03030 [Clostridia bacterium]|nr:hypothetical protein [Clostridia bacterium]
MYGKSTSINNSIPQKIKNVKSDTTITTNYDMQKNEKVAKSDEEIRNIVKYNPDGKEIKDNNYVEFMIERYKDNINISGIETDTKYVETLKGVEQKEKTKLLYDKIENKSFKIIKKLNSKDNKMKTVELDLFITKSGLNESFHKGTSDEKFSVVPFLDNIIKTSQDGIIRSESKDRMYINEWYYLYNTIKINDKLYGVKVDIKKTNQGDRFYVHRVNLINKIRNFDSIRTPLEAEKLLNRIPYPNNSISQQKENVKHTTINNQYMKKNEKNTINNEKDLIQQRKLPIHKTMYKKMEL